MVTIDNFFIKFYGRCNVSGFQASDISLYHRL